MREGIGASRAALHRISSSCMLKWRRPACPGLFLFLSFSSPSSRRPQQIAKMTAEAKQLLAATSLAEVLPNHTLVSGELSALSERRSASRMARRPAPCADALVRCGPAHLLAPLDGARRSAFIEEVVAARTSSTAAPAAAAHCRPPPPLITALACSHHRLPHGGRHQDPARPPHPVLPRDGQGRGAWAGRLARAPAVG